MAGVCGMGGAKVRNIMCRLTPLGVNSSVCDTAQCIVAWWFSLSARRLKAIESMSETETEQWDAVSSSTAVAF